MADFNNFIRRDLDADSNSATTATVCDSIEKAAAKEGTTNDDAANAVSELQEISNPKEEIATMEQAIKLSDERYKKWKAAEADVRRLTQENKHYEEVIVGQQVRFDNETAVRQQIFEAERISYRDYVTDLLQLVESTKKTAAENATAKLEAKHSQEMQAMKIQYEKYIKSLSDEYSKRHQEQQAAHENKLKEVNADHASKIDSINHAHETSLQELRQDNQKMRNILWANKTNQAGSSMAQNQATDENVSVPTNVFHNSDGMHPLGLHLHQYNNASIVHFNQNPPSISNNPKRQHPHGENQAPQNAGARQRRESHVHAHEPLQFMNPTSPYGLQRFPDTFPISPTPSPVSSNFSPLSTDVQQARAALSLPPNELQLYLKDFAKRNAQRNIKAGNGNETWNAVLREEPAALKQTMTYIYVNLRRTAGIDGGVPPVLGEQMMEGLPVPIGQMGWPSVGAPAGSLNVPNKN